MTNRSIGRPFFLVFQGLPQPPMFTEFHQFLSPQWITPKNISFGVSEYTPQRRTLWDPLSRGLFHSHTSNFGGTQIDNLNLLQDLNPVMGLQHFIARSLVGLRPTTKTKTHSGHPCSSMQFLRLPVTKLKSLLCIILITENLMTSRSFSASGAAW